MSVRRLFSTLGTALIALGTLGVVALVAWNVFGQAGYGGDCEHALGCRSFYCIHHASHAGAQVSTPHGRCTQSCETDADCGSGATCVALGDEARDDLPSLGKPDRACLLVQ
jgi:hypothetical protein